MGAAVFLAGAVAAALGPQVDTRSDALTRYGVGLLRARADRPAGAVAQLEAAAKGDPAAVAPRAALAPLYASLGRPAAATRMARAAVAADPADFVSGQLLGQLLYDAKRFPDAVAALTAAAASPRLVNEPGRRLGVLGDLAQAATAAADWPALEAAAQAGLTLADAADKPLWHERAGRALEGQGKFAAAAAEYALAAGPGATPAGRARLAWLLSGCLRAEGRDAEALAQLESVLARKPSGPAAYDRLADLYARLGRADRLPGRLAELAAADPANPSIPWVRADAVARADRAGAARLFRELADAADAPAEFPRLVRFHLRADRVGELLDLVDIYSGAARPGGDDDAPAAAKDAAGRRAVERFRALVGAIKAEPGAADRVCTYALTPGANLAGRRPDTRDLMAVLADRAGRPAAQEAVVRAGGSSGQPRQLLVALMRQKRWNAVVELCETQGKRWNVPGPDWHYFQASALHELGRTADALDAADKAVGSNRMYRATILTHTGQAQAAVALCEQALAGRLDAAATQDARLHLAEALNELGRHADADEQYELCLDADPDSVLVLNNYAYNLADRGRRLPDAEALVRRAIELSRDEHARAGSPDPARGTYLDSLGWVLFRRGKFAEARAALEQASESAEGAADGVVWDHLGDTYSRLGDAAKAKAAWAKAADLYAGTQQGRKQDRRAEALRKAGK